ncbi:hypothetical protein CSOJ01_12463 [Colletotrichum sojae]|uniref:Uncharacterized protein n=1 Tax=Colletotrichum sojae TaxID=2175907 RepID=A0A8H6MMD7_9PEZI|nr:hypothetical protein CSOJ01_12463 [Colletotrichum sojae]
MNHLTHTLFRGHLAAARKRVDHRKTNERARRHLRHGLDGQVEDIKDARPTIETLLHPTPPRPFDGNPRRPHNPGFWAQSDRLLRERLPRGPFHRDWLTGHHSVTSREVK